MLDVLLPDLRLFPYKAILVDVEPGLITSSFVFIIHAPPCRSQRRKDYRRNFSLAVAPRELSITGTFAPTIMPAIVAPDEIVQHLPKMLPAFMFGEIKISKSPQWGIPPL